jgi:hypothetical protein
LPKGPYYLEQDHLFQIYKIQDDLNHAFVVSSVPSQTESRYAVSRAQVILELM